MELFERIEAEGLIALSAVKQGDSLVLLLVALMNTETSKQAADLIVKLVKMIAELQTTGMQCVNCCL